MKTQPKARRMWASNPNALQGTKAFLYAHKPVGSEWPILCIPADPASLAEMRERVAKALYNRVANRRYWDKEPDYTKEMFRLDATAALASLHPALGGKERGRK